MAESYEWGDLIQGQIARPKSLLIRLIADQHLIISPTRTGSNHVVDIENMSSRSSTCRDSMAIEAERKGSNKLMNQPLGGVTIRRRVGRQNGEEPFSGGVVRLRDEVCTTD
jgi:hypothetical protein